MQCNAIKKFHSIPNKHQSFSFNATQFKVKAMQPQILDEQSPSRPESPKSPIAKPTLRKEPSFSRWCGESVEDPPLNLGHSPSPSFDRISIDSDDFELPLLGSPSEIDAQHTSNSFRQRSHAANDNDHKKDRKLSGLDVESGLHVSQSQTKLDQLENEYNLHGYCSGSSSWIAVVARTVFYILIWYSLSTCLTLYNKALLGDKLGKFPAPLLMNTFHFGLQALLSKVIGCFQLRDGTTPITWRDYFVKVVPTAIGTALDINLSNASLVFISVTFATMCKSASPIFLLLFAFAFRLESPSIKLMGIIFIISIGVLLTVARETEFNFFGFMLVMLSAVMAGFRWSLTQILLQKDIYGLKNPITLMSYVSPVMTVVTAILSLLMDPWHEFHQNIYFDNSWHILRSCLLMLVGGSLAFFMVLTEYILISATSAITVTVAGVVKEAVTILVAVVYFHDSFTWLKGTGLLTIMVGVGLFNWYKYQKFKRGQPNENELSSIATANLKYVIIDEADSQDDDDT